MTREQAIFFEVWDDLDLCGSTEALFLAFHDFILTTDITALSDIEVQRKAKECLLRYEHLLNSDHCFYDERWDILETLDLEGAEWEYREQKRKEGALA